MPTPGSVSTIWPVIDHLIGELPDQPGLAGVRCDVQDPKQDDTANESILFGGIHDAQHLPEHLSGGQTRVARTESLEIEAIVRVARRKSMRECARRAFEIATYVEDYLAAAPRMGGDIAGLSWLLIGLVSAEPVDSPRDPVYTVTLTLVGSSRLRGS